MSSLELRVPPPVVALLVAVSMWLLAPVLSAPGAPAFRIALAVVLAVIGLAITVAGVVGFRRAKTTTNPMKPQGASSLVVTGIYRFTRNPMYLGLCLVLIAWATFLWSLWVLLGPLVFIAYITRFQIAPEEKILAALFGDEYSAYRTKVRRWL